MEKEFVNMELSIAQKEDCASRTDKIQTGKHRTGDLTHMKEDTLLKTLQD